MLQAKAVLNQIVADNQDKVNFMMSQYFQAGSGFDTRYDDAGDRRFQYTATSAAPIENAVGDTADRGLQSWQDIHDKWNRIHYREVTGASSSTTCYADVAIQFYQRGTDLATALTTAMNNPTCATARPATRNTYTVTYNAGSGIFQFASNLQRNFEMLWGTVDDNIKGALGVTSGNTGLAAGPYSSGTPYTLLSTANWTGPAGVDIMGMTGSFTDASITYYQAGAARLWNGETIKVQSDGTICDLVASTALSSPAEFTVQLVNTGCVAFASPPAPVVYTFSGAPMTGNSDFCRGYENKVNLVPCDLGDTPSQISLIGRYLDLEFPFNADGTPQFYSEDTSNGTWNALTWPIADDPATPNVDEAQGGIRAAGGTPMANTLIDVKTWFDDIWNNGQTGSTTRVGGPPWQITPIKNHIAPQEKTIVLLVTDGDDTCASRTGDGSTASAANALRTAHKAQMLYDGVAATPVDPASKVQTYLIGYGNGSAPDKMNWIAWGGSGLRAVSTNPGTTGSGEAMRWSATNETSDTAITNALTPARRACKTCQDAFIAPDADTLAAQLQGIINQGAQEGEFIAGRSITESVFEYADLAGTGFSSLEPTPDRGGTNGRFAGSCPPASSRASRSRASTATSRRTTTTARTTRCCAGTRATSCCGSSATAPPTPR